MRFKSTVYILIFCFALILSQGAGAQPFQIVQKNKSVPIVFDQKDSTVVGVAGKALASDIKLISGVEPDLLSEPNGRDRTAIIIGTLGQSSLIEGLVGSGKLDKDILEGKWETFLLKVIENPIPGLDQALVIVGSDPRGTAFGVFELSERLGVSPWVWWADVLPEKRAELAVTLDPVVMGPPSVKYRGIFLNDEDFGLKPWAAQNMDPDVQDIGPNTYEHIFELLLRLKANTIWPAMHKCTKAFFYYEGNQEAASTYQIVIGSSHCEPMLRNNVDEWDHNFIDEYGREPGEWRYDTNREEMATYWEDRVIQTEKHGINGCFTLGMRGIHDGHMPGPSTVPEKVALMNQVFKDQRTMLSRNKSMPLADIPQVFIPYKEVLELYQAGAVPPDDVTIIWPDDNHGYIRKLSNPTEQLRSGGSGVYYHLSYWSGNEDYLWLSSISPALISYEMCKAYDYGADRMWIFNVGDLKPAEMELHFAMDLAWDVDAWRPEKASGYALAWAEETFGAAAASDIAAIKTGYYKLAASGKPEHMNWIPRTMATFDERLAAYSNLLQQAEALRPRIPARLQDAYFQLIYYPVKGTAKLNEKIIRLIKGEYPDAFDAYSEIIAETAVYNTGIAGGKWNGMMDDSPRSKAIFDGLSALPAIRIDLTNDLVSVERPMVFSKGLLYGTSPDQCNQRNGGSAIFHFNSDSAANRLLSFYLNCPSKTEDSFFVRVNGVEVTPNKLFTKKWEWKNIGSFDLVAGQNTIEVIQREPNAKIGAIQFGTAAEQIIPKPILVENEPLKCAVLSATDFQLSSGNELCVIQGIGCDGASLTLSDFTAASVAAGDADRAPSATALVDLQPGVYEVKLYCLPTFAIHEGRALQIGVSLDNSAFQVVDLYTEYKTPAWRENVYRGYTEKTVPFTHKKSGPVELKIALLDPGVAISRVEIINQSALK